MINTCQPICKIVSRCPNFSNIIQKQENFLSYETSIVIEKTLDKLYSLFHLIVDFLLSISIISYFLKFSEDIHLSFIKPMMEQRYLDDFWQIERLRFTAFIRPETDTQSYKSWIDLLDEEPDKFSFSKKENLLQAEGIFNNGKLIFQVQPNRFDWHFSFLEAEEEAIEVVGGKAAKTLQEPNFLTVGPLKEEIVNPFKELMFLWLKGSEQIIRLAFGAVLLWRVEDQTAGYKKINHFLPNIHLDVEARDFLYQINRRRPSRTEISSLEINRLSKWSVARLLHTKRATPGGSACRLELDINTIPEFTETLPVDRLSDIFQEFLDLGVEIAKEGDIP